MPDRPPPDHLDGYLHGTHEALCTRDALPRDVQRGTVIGRGAHERQPKGVRVTQPKEPKGVRVTKRLCPRFTNDSDPFWAPLRLPEAVIGAR